MKNIKKVLLCSLLLGTNLNAMDNANNDTTNHQGVVARISGAVSNFRSMLRTHRERRQYDRAIELCDAVRRDDSTAILSIFLRGGDINLRLQHHRESTTLVSYAIRNSHLRAARTLIFLRCDVNARDSDNATPLIELFRSHDLAKDIKIEIASMLLARGADINAQDNQGNNALFFACYAGHQSVEDQLNTVLFLFERGIDIHASNAANVTAMHIAALYSTNPVVLLLQSLGADVNAKDINGKTPFSYAEAEHLGGKLPALAFLGGNA